MFGHWNKLPRDVVIVPSLIVWMKLSGTWCDPYTCQESDFNDLCGFLNAPGSRTHQNKNKNKKPPQKPKKPSKPSLNSMLACTLFKTPSEHLHCYTWKEPKGQKDLVFSNVFDFFWWPLLNFRITQAINSIASHIGDYAQECSQGM